MQNFMKETFGNRNEILSKFKRICQQILWWQ